MVQSLRAQVPRTRDVRGPKVSCERAKQRAGLVSSSSLEKGENHEALDRVRFIRILLSLG